MKNYNDRSRAAWALRERGFSYGSIAKDRSDDRGHSDSTLDIRHSPFELGEASSSSTDPTIHSSNNPIIRLSNHPSIHVSMLARREAELGAAIGHDWHEP